MAMSMKALVQEARERIEAISPSEAHGGEGLVLDVREPGELDAKGRVPGAVHVPRGLLEASADPESPMVNERLSAAREAGTVDVLCASGARAALAAATLGRMGYKARVIDGGLAAWVEAKLPIER